MYINRLLEEQILKHINSSQPPRDPILLAGARQVGKSTMLKRLFPENKHIHINLALESAFCDEIDQTKSFDDFTFLIESKYQYKIGKEKIIIFDEAQLSKKLGSYVRFMKEIWQSQRVIITGSTLSNLFDEHQKPTGRVIEFVLRPFNFIEFLTALKEDSLIERLIEWQPDSVLSETIHKRAVEYVQKYLLVGGLPEVVMAFSENRNYLEKLANIFAFYKRDFESKLSENLSSVFAQVFLRIAAATGSSITLASIIPSSEHGYKKLSHVLSVLEGWHQILKVECETEILSKVGSITPKRYIFDLGIRFLQNPARFSDINLFDASSVKREDIGGLIENFVLTELLSLHSPFPPRSWGKTHQSSWVDFIFKYGPSNYAIEVKASLKFNSKHLSGLKAWNEYYPGSKLVLANLDKGGRFSFDHKAEVINVPVYALFSFLGKLPST